MHRPESPGSERKAPAPIVAETPVKLARDKKLTHAARQSIPSTEEKLPSN